MLHPANLSPFKQPGFPKGVFRLEYRSVFDGQADWALLQPRGSDWLVKLHGHGATGAQIYQREDLRRNWLPKFLEAGYSLFSPNLRGNAWMAPAAVADLKGLLDYLREQWNARRFFFYSGSMGGTGNLIYAVLHPEDVTSLVALCPATDITSYYRWCRKQSAPAVLAEIATAIETSYGGSPEKQLQTYQKHSVIANASRLTMPVFLGHGECDAIIPVEQSRQLKQLLMGKDNFRFLEITGGDHDSPLALEEPFLWMEKQRNG
ncbi:MAG TPA: alpha/beta hydrolase [bacterium]|nr:alpha/beta hydrolase [bacterium]